jgi:hypothetical protein
MKRFIGKIPARLGYRVEGTCYTPRQSESLHVEAAKA